MERSPAIKNPLTPELADLVFPEIKLGAAAACAWSAMAVALGGVTPAAVEGVMAAPVVVAIVARK